MSQRDQPQDPTTPTHLDGSAAAGPLSGVFAAEVTTAVGRCTACGLTGALAETMVYMDAPGLVVRCVGCEGVLLRLVERPDGRFLDVSGIDYLLFAP